MSELLFLEPTTPAETLAALAEHGDGARLLAGGIVSMGNPGASQVVRESLELLLTIGREGNDRLNLVEVREMLEPKIAARTALRAQESEIAELRAAIAAMDTTFSAMCWRAYTASQACWCW